MYIKTEHTCITQSAKPSNRSNDVKSSKRGWMANGGDGEFQNISIHILTQPNNILTINFQFIFGAQMLDY